MIFRAIAKDSKIDLGSEFNKARLKEWLKEHEGAHLRIEDVKPIRSTSQHKFYWVYLEVISRETGHTSEELHEWAKRKFLAPRFITVMGKELKIPASTTTLSKLDFADYIERISAETGIAPPNPQEAGYISNY